MKFPPWKLYIYNFFFFLNKKFKVQIDKTLIWWKFSAFSTIVIPLYVEWTAVQ